MKKRVLKTDSNSNLYQDYSRGWQNALLTLSPCSFQRCATKSLIVDIDFRQVVFWQREKLDKNTEQGKINSTRINAFSQALRQTWRIECDEKIWNGFNWMENWFLNYFYASADAIHRSSPHIQQHLCHRLRSIKFSVYNSFSSLQALFCRSSTLTQLSRVYLSSSKWSLTTDFCFMTSTASCD